MKQYELRKGSRVVVISIYDAKRIGARLYVNEGETATTQHWHGASTQAAERWAQRQLSK